MFANSPVLKQRTSISPVTVLIVLSMLPVLAFAASENAVNTLDLTSSWLGYAAIALFVAAYALIILEENIHLRKSKPAMVVAGFIWILVAIAYIRQGETGVAEELVRHNLLEFVELFLFLLAAMTFINTMEERGIFSLMRVKLVSQGYSLRQIFWITGLISFFMSPIADNLTTALLMAAVITAVGGTNIKFVSIACINIVVASNSGGAFSPFGDITTLMVWQSGILEFQQFFALFIPSLVNWLVTAGIMSFAIAKEKPDTINEEARVASVAAFCFTIMQMTVDFFLIHQPELM